MKIWWHAIRPKTLTAALVPVVSAAALADFAGFDVEVWIIVFCLLSALSIQMATNLFNDAIDFRKGADTEYRLGPVRVTQKGLVAERAVWIAAFICLFVAIGTGIPLVVSGGWPIVAIGVVSLLLAYAYTGGPFPLAYLGLGDVFVILFFGLIAVGGVFFLISKDLSADAAVLGLQIGFFATALLAINNLRDVNQDRLANKRTLAVRFGEGFAKGEIAVMLLAPFVMQLYWYWRGGLWPSLLPFILLPAAYKLTVEVMRTAPSVKYNDYLARSARLHGGFGALISVGLWIG